MSAALSHTRPVPRRGLSHDEACQYVGVSATIFDRMVKDGRMPGPKRFDGRLVYDLHALDRAFDAMPDDKPIGTGWEDVA
jgi:excisionase family DNA binding protein